MTRSRRSARQAGTRTCERCGADISHRDARARFCNASCAKRKPCARCGGLKEPGKRRYCTACQEVADSADYIRAADRERRRRQRIDEIGAGKVVRRAKSHDPGLKWCSRCQEFRPVANFGKSGDKLAAYCIPCTRSYNHERTLKRQYGITPEDYERLMGVQDGRCAICLTRPRKRRLAVDHDHDTGEVRGLLCTRCNHGLLGKAHDSAAMLRRAVSYLERPPAQTGEPISDHHAEQVALELIREQAPFLTDGQVAWSADGRHVAVTPATFLHLVKMSGRSISINGTIFGPTQPDLSDATFTQLLKEAGYQ